MDWLTNCGALSAQVFWARRRLGASGRLFKRRHECRAANFIFESGRFRIAELRVAEAGFAIASLY
jgi:hypothetical protein